VHRGGRWIGGDTVELPLAPMSSTVELVGFAYVTFPFQQVAAAMESEGAALFGVAFSLRDALPPLGLAAALDGDDSLAVLGRLLPPDAVALLGAEAPDYAAALAVCDRLLATSAQPMIATMALAYATSLGELPRAAEYARLAARLHPSEATRYRLADVLGCIDEGQEEAIALFRAIVAEQPSHHRARLKLGYALVEKGAVDEGVAELQAVAADGWGDEAEEARAALAALHDMLAGEAPEDSTGGDGER